MRFLHTSDWHLGRSLHGVALLDAQVAALERLAEVAATEHVDAVVVAGDLYDRAIPPVEAVEALSAALAMLRGTGARVIAIAGNHDSPGRIGFGGALLDTAGVHVRGDATRSPAGIVLRAAELDDGGPDVVVHAVPYLEPELARHALGAPEARSHEAVLQVALDRARADLAARAACRSIVVAHAFVAGGRESGSERVLGVGGSERVGLGCFDGFDYAALGHLHRHQSMAGGRVRYSGSLLAYSFSERDDRKLAWLVEMAPDGTVSAEPVALPVPRRLAQVRGPLESLLSDPDLAGEEEAWVQAVVTDTTLPREPMARLRDRFPHVLSLVHEPDVPLADARGEYRERIRGRGDLDLSTDFLRHVRGEPPGCDDLADLREVFREIATVEARG